MKTLLFSIAIIYLLALSGNTFAQAASCRIQSLPRGLIAWWQADGNALDSAGTNSGTLMNGATFAEGRFGSAFIFDGVNDHVRLNSQISNHLSFTLSAWVFPQPTATTGFGAIVSTRDGNIEYSPRAGFFLNVWEDRNGAYSHPDADTRYFFTATNLLATNAWSHVLMTVFATNHASNVARLYINGSEVALPSQTRDGGQLSTIDTIIGANYPRGFEHFRGRIDEVRVYDRWLSTSEALTDYRSSPELRTQISVAVVDVCWNSCSNATYQVQYRSELTTNLWMNLGAPRAGTGATQCVADDIRGEPQRFYRIVELP